MHQRRLFLQLLYLLLLCLFYRVSYFFKSVVCTLDWVWQLKQLGLAKNLRWVANFGVERVCLLVIALCGFGVMCISHLSFIHRIQACVCIIFAEKESRVNGGKTEVYVVNFDLFSIAIDRLAFNEPG